MVDRYKPSAGEIREIVEEVGNPIVKEVTTIKNSDGTPCATIIDLPAHGATVVHEHGSGMTYVEDHSEHGSAST